MWHEAKAADPKFGTGQYKASIDEQSDEKVWESFINPKVDFKPYRPIHKSSNITDLLNLLIFFSGRYFFLRGGKEISFLMWEQISFDTYKRGLDVGKRFVQLAIHSDKVNFLSLKNHTINEGNLQFKLRKCPKDPLCPYRIISYYRSICPIKQEQFFCAYLASPNKPIGQNNHNLPCFMKQ